MTQSDIMDKFEAYETEATFTRGNKMTAQVVAMDDIRAIVADIAEELANMANTVQDKRHVQSVSGSVSDDYYKKNNISSISGVGIQKP